MMNALRHMTHLLATGVLTAITVGLASTAHAFSIAQSPLFLSTAVPPNIMFILDDSGSMQTEVMPDSLWSNSNGNSGWMMFPRANRIYCPTCGSERENYVVSFEDGDDYSETRRSSHRNAVFYNPATTYRTWLNADGTPFPNADPTRAYHNPYAPGRGFRDLTNDNTQSAQWVTTNGRTGNESRTFYPAIYYVYDGVGDEDSADSYTRVEIRPANAPFTGSAARTDCAAAPSCTYAEEMQNFANWYSYYRSRVLSARAGIGRAFAQQSRNLRVGFGAINETGNSVDGDTTDTIISGVRPFDGADRANWFDNLYGHDIPYSATPLRRALDDAGQYFSRQDNRGPWGATPGTDDPSPQLECRQNYTILMTDGYWCGAAASTSEARGQVDRDDGPVISSPDGATYQYQGGPPYEDAYSNTLADVAMYYWYRDLRTDLPNAVPTNAQDEAFWQHMVTFGVSLGVTGTLEETDWDDLVSGDQSWPDPDTSSGSCSVETRLDDLWHAGVNGRGGFFSAAEPDAFAEGLSDSLSNIADRIGSAASVASNSTRLEADSLIYQARFNSTDWSGDLLSFTVNPATGAVVSQDWSAADKLDASVATRNILTYDGGSGGSAGATFVWSNLTDAQKTALGGSVRGQAVVDFLRGDRSCEREQVVGSCGYDLDGDGTTGDSGDQAFRARGSRLGDIVSSDPAYSGDEDFGFSVFDSSYTSYVASKASRTPAVFVGANDGMLHAFDARASASNGGEELFAYVPSSLIPDLADLADPAYTHRYYVDGSPVVIDAKIGTGSTAWRTVVLGSTGAGGRTVFALDITRDDLTTTDDGDVLWELTDNRLGVAVPRPAIARFESDTWVALIPNGYNSLNDRAALLVVDLSDGTVLAELDTGVGDNATPNGLGPVVAIDVDTDGEVDYAYAGDMLGNLWRFEFSGSSSSDWSVTDYSVDSGIQPLFTACSAATCTSTNRQPITARPSVTRHPDGGLMVLFGTGSYFQDGDNAPAAATQIQSFYGLRDLATATAISGRSALQEQTILSEGLVPGSSSVGYRVTSNTAVSYGSLRGWYMDLAYDTDEDGGIDASEILGERVVNPAIVRDERVIFSTLIPDTAACSFGGDSWLMVLDAINGARLDFAPLDVTNDGTIDQSDLLALDLDGDGTDEYYEPSGKGYSDKIVEFSEQGFLDDGGSVTEKAYGSSSTGEIEDETFGRRAGFFGRQSWFQVSPPVDD